jgi:anti-sigma B factor antagonist
VKRKALPLIDGLSDVVIDLSRVDFVDSVGIGVLVSLIKAARSRGCNANLIGVSSNVRRVLEIIRLDEIFEVHPDMESASRALAHR